LPSLQFVITDQMSLISPLNSNDRSIPLIIVKKFKHKKWQKIKKFEKNSFDVHVCRVGNILTNIFARHSVDRMGEGGGDWIQS
jgi:hypothetical protein